VSNIKFTGLPEQTAPTGDDIVAIVNDPTGAPVSQKVKLLNLLKQIFLADQTELTITTIADGEYLKRSGANLTSGVPSGTGAPTNATYITQTANGSLTNEQPMAALATGLVKNTTTTGVQSIAAAGTDYVAPSGALGTPSSGTLTNCTADGTDAVGFRNIPVNPQSTAYSTVLADGGKAVLHPVGDNNARTFTIDGSLAYPVGTAITLVNMINTLTIAISTDTLTLMGAGSTGSRSLAADNIATAVKIASGSWIISGSSGLT
jgi:hypothetical protein